MCALSFTFELLRSISFSISTFFTQVTKRCALISTLGKCNLCCLFKTYLGIFGSEVWYLKESEIGFYEGQRDPR